jgi:GNAT superfamily N-acetyltransferase
MSERDCSQVAELCGELGYPTTADAAIRRYKQILDKPDTGMFVAHFADEHQIGGWTHAYGVRLLESDGYVEIGGIVVRAALRKQGVGTSLLRVAERWAREHHFDEVRLRSGVQREDAHLFYVAAGYEQSKASYMFKRSSSQAAP